jgi:ribosomal protein S18 acetylase RimI-like enzyme
MRVQLRATTPTDRVRVERFVRERWGAATIVSRGATHRPSALPGFVALEGSDLMGLVTYSIDGEACEIVTIDSLVERAGIGTALVEAVTDAARAAGCRRLWLVTTNDNLPALRFYQKRGFALVTVHREAVVEARKLKPEIPLVGLDGIPLRDELELELRL